MNIKSIFEKKIDRSINGVVKADQSDEATIYQELNEYVITKELEKHFRSFFDAYSTDLGDTSIANRVGVWISGFFGSGKSHFLKTLYYILSNIQAKDESGTIKHAVDFFDEKKVTDSFTRANIETAVANGADAILFNIDSKASSTDGANPILHVFLRVFNQHLGFSGDHPHIAHMERHLHQRGAYESFKTEFNKLTGSDWLRERDGFHFYQDDIEAALASVLKLSPEAAKKWFEEAEQTFSVSVENFCTWINDYLATKPAKHRLLFLVDEVGQFIGKDTKLMLTLQTITENLGTICKGRAWIVVTSQADMDAVMNEISAAKANDFSKIAGRFKTRLSLSSSNSDEVIQRRLLDKKQEAAIELRALFDEKGDILRNQLCFDRSGPTLKNYDTAESFVANYPFAPYHFQLVQKVFEEIRKVGATGAHLAYGERSMLDAFQLATLAIADRPVGALIPMHSFYRAVEGFLEPAVKRTIDQAADNQGLDSFDVQILRTLFMIRYVDLVKGTLDNLVTLSIEQVDEDKLSLRRKIEATLQRLERESLITKNGDEFLFLTNEERDVTRQIKATDIAASDENKELSTLIFKDIFKDQIKYRYRINKMDYQIGRFLDSHSVDGKFDAELRIEVASPLDYEYNLLNESRCIGKSCEPAPGIALIKLPDDKDFFQELRTYLKTNKYVRLADGGTQPELAKILADRSRENQERKKRLRIKLEDMLLQSETYALGQHLKPNRSAATSLFDDLCQYLLENTYTKLGYIKALAADPQREIHAILNSDDITQIGLNIEGEDGNAQALKELEQYLNLVANGNTRLSVEDVVEKFGKRPFGWPEGEVLLLVARLAALGRISFHKGGPSLPLKEVQPLLASAKTRREVSIQKKRQADEALLTKARNLTKELFGTLNNGQEKELFEFYVSQFNSWLIDLKSYKVKTESGKFPGRNTIEKSIQTLEIVLGQRESVDFFNEVTSNKDTYLDLEEDYSELQEFYTKQITAWTNLVSAVARFEHNRNNLEKDEKARTALGSLHAILANPSPYGELHRIAGLISVVDSVNTAFLDQYRAQATAMLEAKIRTLQAEIDKSPARTPELSNRLLMPLQKLKSQLPAETSIAHILMIESRTSEECFDEAAAELEDAEKRLATPPQPYATGATSTPAPVPTPPPAKPVVEVQVRDVFQRSAKGLYLESTADIESFLDDLREELEKAITQNKRIKLR